MKKRSIHIFLQTDILLPILKDIGAAAQIIEASVGHDVNILH